MNVIMVNPVELKNYEKNARTHSSEQIEQIVKSIKDYGFNVPVEVNSDFVILSGHARVRAATEMGLDKIPVIVHEHLKNESKQKGYILAANKIAMNAGWDDDILTDELRALMQEPDFDMESTGFGLDELAAMFPPEDPVRLTDDDEVPGTPKESRVKLGDVWTLGEHRLMCGDSTSIDAVDKLMDGNKVDMVFTDPPYNVAFNGRSGKFNVIENDDLADNEFEDFIKQVCAVITTLNSPYYVWCNWKFYGLLQSLLEFKACIVWAKNNFGLGQGYRHQHEFCLTNAKIDDGVKNESDLWQISKDANYVHPTQKPIALAERALNNHKKANYILDLFGGSGSTLIACEKLQRKCYMMELDPVYCEVILQRWENFTGKRAQLV